VWRTALQPADSQVVLTNPPFGGKERNEVQQNFPIHTGETASDGSSSGRGYESCDEIGLLHRKEVSGFRQMDLRPFETRSRPGATRPVHAARSIA